MNDTTQYCTYRLNWTLFKALFGLNLLLLKLLLVVVKLSLALH